MLLAFPTQSDGSLMRNPSIFMDSDDDYQNDYRDSMASPKKNVIVDATELLQKIIDGMRQFEQFKT